MWCDHVKHQQQITYSTITCTWQLCIYIYIYISVLDIKVLCWLPERKLFGCPRYNFSCPDNPNGRDSTRPARAIFCQWRIELYRKKTGVDVFVWCKAVKQETAAFVTDASPNRKQFPWDKICDSWVLGFLILPVFVGLGKIFPKWIAQERNFQQSEWNCVLRPINKCEIFYFSAVCHTLKPILSLVCWPDPCLSDNIRVVPFSHPVLCLTEHARLLSFSWSQCWLVYGEKLW